MKKRFSKYLDRLKLADSYYLSALRTKPNVRPSKKALTRVPGHNFCLSSSGLKHRKAESEYEKAIEILEELLADEPSLVMYLDRPVILTGDGCNVSPSPEDVPRLINSRSQFARRTRSSST
jgi:hypothetical protein